jgi:hypothetical protein
MEGGREGGREGKSILQVAAQIWLEDDREEHFHRNYLMDTVLRLSMSR